MGEVTQVDGIDNWLRLKGPLVDTNAKLDRCRHCGAEAGIRQDPRGPIPLTMRAECSNTSCGISTPFHYTTVEDATYAWNRRPGDPPKKDENLSKGKSWTAWAFKPPPLGTLVEVQYSPGDSVLRGRRCLRGCCFLDERTPDEMLARPLWWRLP